MGDTTDMRKQMLEIMHSSSYGGHSGILGTYLRTKAIFFWKEEVTDFSKKL